VEQSYVHEILTLALKHHDELVESHQTPETAIANALRLIRNRIETDLEGLVRDRITLAVHANEMAVITQRFAVPNWENLNMHQMGTAILQEYGKSGLRRVLVTAVELTEEALSEIIPATEPDEETSTVTVDGDDLRTVLDVIGVVLDDPSVPEAVKRLTKEVEASDDLAR